MIDYFALLDQPRQPWLDPNELKEAFHAKSRQAHPDVAGSTDDTVFAQLNEAYRVLGEPKLRIAHLHELAGRSPAARDSSVPDDVAALFPAVAELAHAAGETARKLETATNPLSRSLLRPQLLAMQQRLAELLERLSGMRDSAHDDLRAFSADTPFEETGWARLAQIYVRLSYLGRWISELEEKQLRLTNV